MNAGIDKFVRYVPIWPNRNIMSLMTQRSVFKQQARVLKALANESRLMIIDRLNRGECSVGELTVMIGSDGSTVSKHLALLRANGIVEDRRQGTTVFYRLLTLSLIHISEPTRRTPISYA